MTQKEVFLKSLGINETEFERLLHWSVLPASGFSLVEAQWVESSLGFKVDTPAEDFLAAAVELGVVEPVVVPASEIDGVEADGAASRYQIEVPWHRLTETRSLIQDLLRRHLETTIEKLRQITVDFSSKELYPSSCVEFAALSRLIFHALRQVLLEDERDHEYVESFWSQIFHKSFFGRVEEASVVGAFWYLRDRMEEVDREFYAAFRDAVLDKADWSDHPLLLGLIIRIEKVHCVVRATKKKGDSVERKELIQNMEIDLVRAKQIYDMEDHPCIMGLYYDAALEIREKAPLIDGTRRDAEWKTELRYLCARSIDYWQQARDRYEGKEDACHVIIQHIHAVSKEAHLQMMGGQVQESDVGHDMVLKEAEKRYGDHKITATFASFYGDYYMKRLSCRAAGATKEDDYRRAMQFFMKEYRILQNCDKRDQNRVKINLSKQGYVKGLMGYGKEAIVDAKKAYLMGEESRDWRSEGSGYLRYNYLNIIFLHWMNLEDKQAMGTQWWMHRELKTLLLPEQFLQALRQTNSIIVPKGCSEKPSTHEELVHNLIVAVYRVQARPRLLSPRIHPAHHVFWHNVLEEYIISEEDQIVALEAVRIYMRTGGVIVPRRGQGGSAVFPSEGRSRSADKENVASYSSEKLKEADGSECPEGLSQTLQKVCLKDENIEIETKQSEEMDEADIKLQEAVNLLRETDIISATILGKWNALRGFKNGSGENSGDS